MTDVGGAALYEAAVKLKEAIRGRALLLILNRTDIVDATGASGVALSSDGLFRNSIGTLLHSRLSACART